MTKTNETTSQNLRSESAELAVDHRIVVRTDARTSPVDFVVSCDIFRNFGTHNNYQEFFEPNMSIALGNSLKHLSKKVRYLFQRDSQGTCNHKEYLLAFELLQSFVLLQIGEIFLIKTEPSILTFTSNPSISRRKKHFSILVSWSTNSCNFSKKFGHFGRNFS